MEAGLYDPFRAIEDLYLTRRRKHTSGPEDFDRKLAKAIAALGCAYRSHCHPDFTRDLDRLGYVIQYAPIGMAALCRLMDRLRSKRLPPQLSIFYDEPLKIVSVGAGPGTDLFGVLMSLAIPPHRIAFTRIDIHSQWATYYETFRDDFVTQIPEMESILKSTESIFIQMDLREESPSEGETASQLGQADIVILNRVLSTFQDDERCIRRLIRQIVRACRHNTLLVILDVGLPKPQLQRAVTLFKKSCRLKKPASTCIVRFRDFNVPHFGWDIPETIMCLEHYEQKITRSGSFFGGIVLLQDHKTAG